MAEENRIVVLVAWEGFTKEIYEEARKQVNFEGDIPQGLVSHIAAFDKNGIRVTDVWKSEEYFKNYVQNRLMPVARKLAKGEPTIEVFPLHALFIP
jgi:hypothetical protein